MYQTRASPLQSQTWQSVIQLQLSQLALILWVTISASVPVMVVTRAGTAVATAPIPDRFGCIGWPIDVAEEAIEAKASILLVAPAAGGLIALQNGVGTIVSQKYN